MRHFLIIFAVLAPLTHAASGAAGGGQQEYLAAVQTFESLKVEAFKNGDMPHLSDPRPRKTLDVLSNRSRTFG
jgi:hypothetical protein